jgi:predicted dinucleotide-binding enzyme
VEVIMKIAILGAGNIGRTLGVKWAAAGHEVVFGVRDVGSPKVAEAVAATGGKVKQVSTGDAIQFGEVVLFAIPWGAVAPVVSEHQKALEGKILIDATNQFGALVVNNLEAFETYVPTAQVYRAYNSLGWEIFESPEFGSVVADLFYSGPDGASRTRMEELIRDSGLEPVWVGDNDRIQLVDNIGSLWVTLAFRQGYGRGVAFKLLSRG